MVNIVLIEDEPGIVDFVTRGLTAAGLNVTSARDGDDGLRLALDSRADLVVLDLMLPRRSGTEILRELAAQRPGLPVIVLTARGELQDRLDGLRGGAVDYIVKPFALAELDARIHAQLRSARKTPATTLRAGGLLLDLLSRTATHDGCSVRLTNTEFELLHYFMGHPGQVLSRRQIECAVWGYDHYPATNVVDVYVSYLRRKLARPDAIVTVRSRGYRLGDLT